MLQGRVIYCKHKPRRLDAPTLKTKKKKEKQTKKKKILDQNKLLNKIDYNFKANF